MGSLERNAKFPDAWHSFAPPLLRVLPTSEALTP